MNEHPSRNRLWFQRLESGEYIQSWRGYAPSYAGCFYGDTYCLGGEDKYKHCYDFFSGIGDVEWWIVAELDKLTDTEKDELEAICARNKSFADLNDSLNLRKVLGDLIGVDYCEISRLGNKNIKRLYDLMNMDTASGMAVEMLYVEIKEEIELKRIQDREAERVKREGFYDTTPEKLAIQDEYAELLTRLYLNERK